jgi:putative drug exporter of the RND superfamily
MTVLAASLIRIAAASQLAAAVHGHHHRRLILLVIVVVVIAAAIAGVIAWRRSRARRGARGDGGTGTDGRAGGSTGGGSRDQGGPAPVESATEDRAPQHGKALQRAGDAPAPGKERGALYGIGLWSARHRVVVILGWLVIVAAVVIGNSALGGVYSDNFSLPGTPAQQGSDLLQAHRTGGQGGQSGYLVFTTSSGTLASHRSAIEQSMANIRKLPDVLSASDPLMPGAVSKDGRTAYASAHFSVNPQQLGQAYVNSVTKAMSPARSSGVAVNYGGQLGAAAKTKNRDPRSEVIGILVAIIVLLLGFGSVYAAGLPILSALAGAFAGVSALGMLAAATTFPTVSPTLAIMMWLGVGIDYSLFLATRHRQLVMDGTPPVQAAARSLAASGHAVLVAATTVIIALLGLYASGLTYIGKLGLAAGITVAVAALSAITVVPALLAVAGASIDRLRVRRPVAEASAGHTGWLRYAEVIGAHPWRFLGASVALLAVLAIPAFSMQLGHIDASADPAGSTARLAYDELRAGFGPGANGPFTIVAQLGPGVHSIAGRQALAGRLHASLASTPDVAAVARVKSTPDGALLYATVLPATGPQAAATDHLMQQLQDSTLPGVLGPTSSRGYVTGSVAGQLQFRDLVSSRLPYIIATVILAAFVILLLSFRSPVLALKAGVLNLLSIGASYGIIVAVFQWGWGSSLLGVNEKVPIESYVPMMIFAIVFGLSMDYEVFLLSRIREAWLATGDNHQSVARGLAGTARVITCAALIMASVFAAFLMSTNVTIKMLALGLALSVIVDASVIRLVVVPATMFLLGTYNWWTPRWLDAILPGTSRPATVPAAQPESGHAARSASVRPG